MCNRPLLLELLLPIMAKVRATMEAVAYYMKSTSQDPFGWLLLFAEMITTIDTG
jgi:hypothetical protein